MARRVLMKGNEAIAETAIRSGCRFYFGYPITPQNEVPEYMSRELSRVKGTYLQAESEIAAINMAYGAAISGGKVLISSSSPGIALMQEGFSYMASAEVPCVILSVSRGGPGIGSIQPSQADYYQATRGGGNGDYRLIVLAPGNIQESINLMEKAFQLASKYRNPVMLLIDGIIGQMMEAVSLPEEIIQQPADQSWILTGKRGKANRNVVKSVYLNPNDLEKRNIMLKEKYNKIEMEESLYEASGLEGAEIVFVAYGTTSRAVKETIKELSNMGIKAGLIRPITLWPFPAEAFEKISLETKKVLCVEMSQGQMIDDVKIALEGKFPVSFYGRSGGIIINPEEITQHVEMLLKEIPNEDDI